MDRQLRSLVRRRVGNREDAEDIAQESWARVARAVQTGRGGAIVDLRAYLFHVARNLIVDHRRRTAAAPRTDADEIRLLTVRDPRPDPESALVTRSELRRMDRIIAAMPDKPRQVFRLARIEGLSFAEIGRRLGLSRQTVHEHMTRALIAIQLAAAADFGEEP